MLANILPSASQGIRRPKLRSMIRRLVVIVIVGALSPQLHADAPVSGEHGKPPSAAWLGDPVYVNSGAYGYALPLLHLGGPLPLDYVLTYRTDNSWMGLGVPTDPNSPARFQHSIFPDVESWPPDAGGAVRVYFETMREGELVSFIGTQSGGTWSWAEQEASPVRYALQRTASGAYWLMDPNSERIYLFEPYSKANGYRILAYMDRNENRWTYSYANTGTLLPARVEDGRGRFLQFTFASTPAFELRRALTGLTDQSGRTISFESTPLAYYTSVTDAAGNRTRFSFDGAKYLTQVTRPLGNAPYRQAYAEVSLNGRSERRTVAQTDAHGGVTRLTFDAATNAVSVAHPDNTTEIFRSFANDGALRSITDQVGNKVSFTQTALGQTSGVTDRLAGTTAYAYHPASGKVASVTNAKGKTIAFTYTAQAQSFTHPLLPAETVNFTFHNLARIDFPDQTREEFTYDGRGNLLSRTDRAGGVTSFTYNPQGQVLTVENPAHGVVTYTYNPDGTLASSRDTETGTVTYQYDSHKRLSQIKLADGTFRQYVHNPNDQVTSSIDELGRTTGFTYDANGNLTRITDATGKWVEYSYDLMDRVTALTDRAGKAITYAYDAMGRVASTTNPTGTTIAFAYDPRGWRNQVTLGGQTWHTAYNDEGAVLSVTTPTGKTVQRTVDALGMTAAAVSPTGGTMTLVRDAMNRIVGVTDPLSRVTQYGYDPRGLLAQVTLPGGGTATYRRDAAGALDRIADLNGNDWGFTRSPMGRMSTAADPLNQVRQSAYDSRGRPQQTTFPDATTLTLTTDGRGNPTRFRYSGGPDLHYGYDSLNRLTDADGLHLIYDVEGRITGTDDAGMTFGATRDDAGRVIAATYANGAFTVNYAYAPATGLLSTVSDTLTGAQVQFTYDADQRLIGIQRSNGVSTALTWNASSLLTGLADGKAGNAPFIDIQGTFNAAGRLASSQPTVPLAPESVLAQDSRIFTYDAASQVSSAGFTYDRRGRLTAGPGRSYAWDGASRLTGADGATLTYNGLNDLRTRSSGGTNRHHYYQYALGFKPLVAERNGDSGPFTRYYVWTPGGKLLYMIDANAANKVYFYHFDRGGSTLALTDERAAVTDVYAYTPYGAVLQHQGTTAQPFTYAGQFGVRQEDAATGSGAATLFQMGARYYDAATGRFLSREPLWPHPADPRQLNPYAYAFNDPAGFADQSGLAPVTTDSYRWEFSWYSGGMMHSVYGVASGTGSWLLPGIGMVAPPPAPKPSALQARWIASCGGNTQAFNKMLGLIASHMGSGSAGPGYYDISENASWHVPYGEGWLNPIIGAQQSTGTTGAPDYGAYTFGSLSYINQAALSATGSNWWGYSPSAAYGYDYGPGTYGASMAGVTTLLPSQSLSSGPYAFGSLDYLFQTALHAPLWDYVFPSMGYGYDTGPMTFGGPFGGPFSYAPYGGPFSYPP